MILLVGVGLSLPRTFSWVGEALSGVNEEEVLSEVTLELKQYNRFFGESYFTGFVSVDGSR